MKNKIRALFYNVIFIVCYCLFTTIQANAHGVNDTSEFYLEMTGRVRQMKNLSNDKGDNPWLDSAIINVYTDSSLYNQLLTNNRGRCSFKLALNKDYLVKISKPGFVTKIIEVNTTVPKNKMDVFDFDFDIDIFELVKDLDVSILEKPIAKVAYNPSEKLFAYDIGYTNRINTALKIMYRNYYLLKKKHKKKDN